MKKITSVFCAVLSLALLVSPLAACGAQDGKAASVRLARTQGSVSVWDKSEKSLEPRADLGLYDGYRMATAAESYGWLSLDKERLAKLDAASEAAVTRAGRQLELTVNAGSLFFNIDTPLEADETLDIRTSNMMVGIRGTCGWVSVTEAGSLHVCLLAGAVECTVTQEDGAADTQTVSAGQQGELLPDGTITVTPLCREDVPDFVLEELTQKPELTETLPARDDDVDPTGAGGNGTGDGNGDGDSAGDADPMAPYAEDLAAMPVSDGTSPGLVYTELIDFECDGDPELLVVTIENPGQLPADLTSAGPVPMISIYRGDGISDDSLVTAQMLNSIPPAESVRLSRAADGRLFVSFYLIADDGSGIFGNEYVGPVYPQGDGQSEWWELGQSIFFDPLEDQYIVYDYSKGENGEAIGTEISAAEYTHPFTELRVLVSW